MDLVKADLKDFPVARMEGKHAFKSLIIEPSKYLRSYQKDIVLKFLKGGYRSLKVTEGFGSILCSEEVLNHTLSDLMLDYCNPFMQDYKGNLISLNGRRLPRGVKNSASLVIFNVDLAKLCHCKNRIKETIDLINSYDEVRFVNCDNVDRFVDVLEEFK